MRIVRLAACSLVLSAVALASNGNLPRTASSDVKSAIERADAALADGDRQLALALYKGSLYSTQVKIAVDRSTTESESQFWAVTESLNVWRDELDGDLPITLVEDLKAADVVVRFVDTIPERGADALGLIKLEKNYRWSKSFHSYNCRGTIYVVRASQGSKLSFAEIRDVVMHEVGHLLGLADAPNPGVLMGPLERGKPLERPTRAETEDIKELRRTIRERLRAAGSQAA